MRRQQLSTPEHSQHVFTVYTTLKSGFNAFQCMQKNNGTWARAAMDENASPHLPKHTINRDAACQLRVQIAAIARS